MALIPINRNPSLRMLRQFGLIWLVAFGLLAAAAWRRGDTTAAAALGAVAALVPALGWGFPPLLRWVYLAATYATWPIGWVVSHLLLGLVYYGLLTPIGLALRLAGKDLLQRRFDPAASSYWLRRPAPPEKQRYFRQF